MPTFNRVEGVVSKGACSSKERLFPAPAFNLANARLRELMDEFAGAGLGGFAVARNRQGKSLGIRSQSIPEFDPT